MVEVDDEQFEELTSRKAEDMIDSSQVSLEFLEKLRSNKNRLVQQTMIGELFSVPKKKRADKFGMLEIKFSSSLKPPSLLGSKYRNLNEGEQLSEIELLDMAIK